MRKYLFQRSTLFGLFIIFCALAGVYFNFLEDNTAILWITFGASGLIPENCPLAHKILAFIAPILVQQIRHKALSQSKNTKSPFEQAPIRGACSFLPPVLARSFHQKPDFNSIYTSKGIFMDVSRETKSPALGENAPSITTVEAQIEEIIINLLGDKLTESEKAKLHAFGNVLSHIISALLPFAGNAIDTAGLIEGLFTFNAGILQEEAGFKQILNALKKVPQTT